MPRIYTSAAFIQAKLVSFNNIRLLMLTYAYVYDIGYIEIRTSERHAAIYLASRILAAACNVLGVAIFTRLVTQETYGQYLLGFACAFLSYGFAVQWVLHAHFGRFEPASAARLATAALVTAGLALAPASALIVACTGLGVLDPQLGWGCGALLVGLTLFFAMAEIGRVHLLAGAVTLASLLRGILVLTFGSAALLFAEPSAPALLGAIALAHILAAVPVMVALRRTAWSSGMARPEWSDVAGLLAYGWPLVLSLGTAAVALNADRVLLEHFVGAAAMAPYGAATDLIRQSFVLFGEAVAAAFVSVAKAQHAQGQGSVSRATLGRGFLTLSYVLLFGLVFFLLMGKPLLALLLPESYLDTALSVLPTVLLGTVFLTLRAYYFGQVIYFMTTPKRDLAASILMLVVTLVAGLLLIPALAATGAALAFALGQAAALGVFLASDPRGHAMPRDLLGVARLAIAAGVTVLGGLWVESWAGPWTAAGINLLWTIAMAAVVLVAADFFGIRSLLVGLFHRRQWMR